MLISGLKLVAKGWPWSPPLQSRMSMVSISSKRCFLGVRAEDVGDPGVEARAQERHDSSGFEALLVRPLPLVFELRLVRRLVVGGVEVVDAGFQAGVHQGQVLVGKRDVDQQVGLDPSDQRHGLRDVVGVHLGDLDFPAAESRAPVAGSSRISPAFGSPEPTSEKVPASPAHLWVTTPPTPPAPMINTLPIETSASGRKSLVPAMRGVTSTSLVCKPSRVTFR